MTYRDTRPTWAVTNPHDEHAWHEFTQRRLAWLYGPNHAKERFAMTQADIEAWRRIGTGTNGQTHPQLSEGARNIHTPPSLNDPESAA